MKDSLLPGCKAVAMDLDGTIASHLRFSSRALDCLRRAKESGLLLFLITSRFASELLEVEGGALQLFDDIVTECGAVHAASTACYPHRLGIAFPEPARLVLRRLDGANLAQGEAIFKGPASREQMVRRALRGLAEPPEVLTNRDDLLVVPRGTNKAVAMRHLAAVRGVIPAEVVAVGDGEVDVDMLRAAGLSFAPHDATGRAREAASVVLRKCGPDATCDLLARLAAR